MLHWSFYLNYVLFKIPEILNEECTRKLLSLFRDHHLVYQ